MDTSILKVTFSFPDCRHTMLFHYTQGVATLGVTKGILAKNETEIWISKDIF